MILKFSVFSIPKTGRSHCVTKDQDVVDEIVIKESIPGFLYEINAVVNVYGYENHCTVLLNSAGEILISPVNVRIVSSRSLPVDISVLSC